MAVTLSVLILKGGCHDWTIVMDSVVNGKGRHYPLATRKTVGRSGVGIVQCESSAQGVGDRLQHVCPANGRTCNLQLAFLLRLNDVKIAVTINILQRVGRTIDTVRGWCTRVGWNLDADDRNVDGQSKRCICRLWCRCWFTKRTCTLPTDRLVKAITCIEGNSDTVTILPYLVRKTVRVDVDKIVFLFAFRGYETKACGEATRSLVYTLVFLIFKFSPVMTYIATCANIIRKTLTTLYAVKSPINRFSKGIAQI